MKKTIIALSLTALMLGGVISMASPASIYAELTGISVEEAYALKTEGVTFRSLSQADGVWEEFKAKMLEEKLQLISERVKEGKLTEEQAEVLITRIEERILNCDGGGQEIKDRLGLGFDRSSHSRMGNRENNPKQRRSGEMVRGQQ